MNVRIESSARPLGGLLLRTSLVLAVAAVLLSAGKTRADDEFQDLVNLIPRAANAVVLLNMEKAKNSPMGLKEDWKSKIDGAFEAGLSRVPPQATRFVLASQIDFEFMEPLWEAAVIELNQVLSSKEIENMRHGTLDTIEGLPAIARPNDIYIIKMEPRIVGAMGPANRQAVVRWIRETRKSPLPPLSPYLQKAAVYSDKAGSEIIMAIDLDGIFSFERVGKYLKSKQKHLDEWGADLMKLTNLLDGVQGIRVGVRIGEEPSGMIVIDLKDDASMTAPYAKSLLLQIMADCGAKIPDLYSWTATAKGNEISLSGKLSQSGLRRMMSVVSSPAAEVSEADVPVSPGELPAMQAKASLKHFKEVTGMAGELKEDMRNSKNLASTTLWFDKYARRIERLPILNVDPALVDYSAYIARQLRQASVAVKTMGIQSGVRSAQVTSGTVGGYDGTRWGGYGYYGGYGYGTGSFYGDQRAGLKAAGEERRAIEAEERGIAATDVDKIRQGIISATADIRRKMTEKYQMQF